MDDINPLTSVHAKQKKRKWSDYLTASSSSNHGLFWNESTLKMSKKLWLPTAIDCVDMDLSSSSTSSRRLIQNSWFLVKAIKRKTYLGSLPMISSPYTTFITECNGLRFAENRRKRKRTEIQKKSSNISESTSKRRQKTSENIKNKNIPK